MKTNAARILDARGIPYKLLSYSIQGEFDGIKAAEALGLPAETVFKTLILTGDRTGPLAACLPVDAQLSMKLLSVASGNKAVAMLPPGQVPAVTGYVRGGVSPIGMKKKLPVFIDDSCLLHPEIGVSGGKKGVELLLAGTDLCAAAEGALCRLV